MKHLKTIKAILTSLLAPAVAASLHAAPPVPTGLFYLPSNRTIDSNALNNSNVDGVVIGGQWSDLEPTQGTFVFNVAANGQPLDTLVALVEASNNGRGKPMRLEIATGGPDVNGNGQGTSRGSKPHWLIQEITNDSYMACKFFTYKDSNTTTATIPVFWEPTLLAEHATLVQAVANHLAGHPLIKVVFVPYANAVTDDWNIGDTSNVPDGIPDPCGSATTPQGRWLNTIVGTTYTYMSDALIAAGNYTYNAYHTAFPNTLLTTSIGRLQNSALNPNGGSTGRNISETVVSTANNNWPGYIVAQKQNLNGGCPSLPCPGGGVPPAPGILQDGTLTAWNDLYRLLTIYGIPTAAQMVFHAYADAACAPDNYLAQRMDAGNNSSCLDSTQMLYQAVNTGGVPNPGTPSYQTQWQEIYELDINNLGSSNADPHIPAGVPSDVITYAHRKLYRCNPTCQ